MIGHPTLSSHTLADFTERAARGASVLDRASPGWHSWIATAGLAMESNEDCVLGRLFGSFVAGLMIVGPWIPFGTSVEDHGFALGVDDDILSTNSIGENFRLLTVAWRTVIRVRSEGGAP